jgi:prepilin-type N-terminal cleavage/methylation domain-containing protein
MRHRGFSLLELIIVIAILLALAVAGYAYYKNASRNAASANAASDIATRLNGLRARSLRDGQPFLLVVLAPPANDPSQCGLLQPTRCLQACVLRNPQPAWVIDNFDPTKPIANAVFDECQDYGPNVRFAMDAPLPAPSAPFTGLPLWDPALLGKCAAASDRPCIAIRFLPDGTASPEFAGGLAKVPKTGLAFAIGTDAGRVTLQRGVLVSFPYGIVKTF